MSYETEKLKKRLELMNQELAKKRRKLKKHSRKKLKLAEDSSDCLKNESGDCMNEKPYSPPKTDNALNDMDFSTNPTMFSSYSTDLTATNELNVMTNFSLTDCLQDVPTISIINNQDSISYDRCVIQSQTSIQNVSLQGISRAEDESIQFGQASVAKSFQNFDNTPQRTFSKSNSRLSPILMQKSGSKSQDRHLQKKIKNFPLSRLKRKDFSSSEISDSIENSVISSQIDDYLASQSNASATIICSNSDTLPVVENKYSIDHMQNNFAMESEAHIVQLPKLKGQISVAFCRDNYFISVDENEVNFWNLEEVHLHIGTLPHENNGTSLGCKGDMVKVGSQDMFVCMELWATEINTLSKDLTTTLTCTVYCYNITKNNLKSYSLHLEHLQGHIKNVQMCLLPEMSLIVSWVTHDTKNCTSITKYSVDNDLQLVPKSTELSSVENAINSLHCIKGCWAVILGENDTHINLWEHCTGVLVKTIHCPRSEAILQWVEEDQGFLFIAVSTQTHIKFIVLNLTNSKWKQLQEFSISDAYKLMGVRMYEGRLVAVLLQEILCWDLKSGLLLTEKHMREENIKAFLGEKYVVHINTDFTVNFVCLSSLEMSIDSSLTN